MRGLPGAYATSAFPGVVDGRHDRAKLALQVEQIGQQRRYVAAGDLVDAVLAHE